MRTGIRMLRMINWCILVYVMTRVGLRRQYWIKRWSMERRVSSLKMLIWQRSWGVYLQVAMSIIQWPYRAEARNFIRTVFSRWYKGKRLM